MCTLKVEVWPAVLLVIVGHFLTLQLLPVLGAPVTSNVPHQNHTSADDVHETTEGLQTSKANFLPLSASVTNSTQVSPAVTHLKTPTNHNASETGSSIPPLEVTNGTHSGSDSTFSMPRIYHISSEVSTSVSTHASTHLEFATSAELPRPTPVMPTHSSSSSSSSTSSTHQHTTTSGSSSRSDSSASLLSDTTTSSKVVVPFVNPGRKVMTTTLSKPKPNTMSTENGGSSAEETGNHCSRRDGMVTQCLIAIASLAGVATIFMVTSIALCTKLSSRRHHYRISRQHSTEMVCISSLLADGDGPQPRPRHPKSNGALIPNMEDSDADNLTLNSFLPENERGS